MSIEEADWRDVVLKVRELDKDVAVIKVQMSGIVTDMGGVRADVRETREISEKNTAKLIEIEGRARGAWSLLLYVQLVVGVLVALDMYYRA